MTGFCLSRSIPQTSIKLSSIVAGAQRCRSTWFQGSQKDWVEPLTAEKIQRQRAKGWGNQKGIYLLQLEDNGLVSQRLFPKWWKYFLVYMRKMWDKGVGPCRWAVRVKWSLSWTQLLGRVLLAQDSPRCLSSFGYHQGMLCSQGLLPELRDKLERTQLKSMRSKWRPPKSSFSITATLQLKKQKRWKICPQAESCRARIWIQSAGCRAWTPVTKVEFKNIFPKCLLWRKP